MGYIVHGVTESDTTERLHFTLFFIDYFNRMMEIKRISFMSFYKKYCK